MALGTGEHGDISEFVNAAFKAEIQRAALPWTSRDMKIGIQSPRGSRWDTVRVPDVVVLPSDQWASIKKRESMIALHEPPPLLVVGVAEKLKKLRYTNFRIHSCLKSTAFTGQPLFPSTT